MMVKRGMKIEDVLKVREDIKMVDVDEYEGISEDGGVLCIETEDGIVVEVVKAMYV